MGGGGALKTFPERTWTYRLDGRREKKKMKKKYGRGRVTGVHTCWVYGKGGQGICKEVGIVNSNPQCMLFVCPRAYIIITRGKNSTAGYGGRGGGTKKKKSLMQCIDLWHTEWCVCMGFEGSSRYSSSCCRSSLMRLRHRPINYPHAQTAPYYVRTYLPMYIYIYITHIILWWIIRVFYINTGMAVAYGPVRKTVLKIIFVCCLPESRRARCHMTCSSTHDPRTVSVT